LLVPYTCQRQTKGFSVALDERYFVTLTKVVSLKSIFDLRYIVEMCMGMGFPVGTGIPWEWE